jgi:hypothetical protein
MCARVNVSPFDRLAEIIHHLHLNEWVKMMNMLSLLSHVMSGCVGKLEAA